MLSGKEKSSGEKARVPELIKWAFNYFAGRENQDIIF